MRKVCIWIIAILSIAVLLTGCGNTEKKMEKCISEYNTEYIKILDASNVGYDLDVSRSDYEGVINNKEQLYFFDAFITFDEEITNQQLFDLITQIEKVRVEDTVINTRYKVGNHYCYIIYDYCLERGEDEYSPISQKNFDDLSISEKRCICEWIEAQYNKYDRIAGKYTGDIHSDTIWAEASELFGLSDTEINLIWMKQYDYK